MPELACCSQRLPDLDESQRYSVSEAAAYLRVSRPTVYKMIAEGRLESICEGSRRFVPGTEIARLSRAPGAGSAA